MRSNASRMAWRTIGEVMKRLNHDPRQGLRRWTQQSHHGPDGGRHRQGVEPRTANEPNTVDQGGAIADPALPLLHAYEPGGSPMDASPPARPFFSDIRDLIPASETRDLITQSSYRAAKNCWRLDYWRTEEELEP